MLMVAPLTQLSLAVVGAQHANKDKSNRRFEIRLCAPGDRVELRREPKNKFDERAVAVFSERGIQLGYLTAERCGRIGALIREGRELQAVFQAETQFGALIRVAFDGEVPALPPVRPQLPAGADREFEWQADEEWSGDEGGNEWPHCE